MIVGGSGTVTCAVQPALLPVCGGQALDVEAELAIHARARAPLRRAMAALARRFVRGRAWEPLGFARLRDYATERLGISARSLYELAKTEAALAALPRIEAALVAGKISWTKVRLLARVARPGDEAHWLAAAGRMTASALSREVRAVDVGSIERRGLCSDEEDTGKPAYENVLIRCTPEVQGKWYRARQLAWRVIGHAAKPWECGEMIAAEVLSAIPMDMDTEEGDRSLAGPCTSPAECAPHHAWPRQQHDTDHAERPVKLPPRARQSAPPHEQQAPLPPDNHTETTRPPSPPQLPAFVKPLVIDLDRIDEFELDRRLRRAVALEQRIDAELGSLLFRAVRDRIYRSEGAATLEEYAREHLGISPRKVRALLRLERASLLCPALAHAYREGRLSWVQAHAIVPIVLINYGHPRSRAWIYWATQVSVRRLQDDVDRALVMHETDPDLFAATGGLTMDVPGTKERTPAGTEDTHPHADGQNDQRSPTGAAPTDSHGKRQIGAQPRVSRETTLLFFHAPRDVARFFRAVLSTVRRRIERQTGHMPTPGEAFGTMLEHAFDTWGTLDQPTRAAHRVFARDGWRCTVPGCSSYRNLQDHHIVFRSAGGSNDLSNRTTLCAWHHLRGVHARVVRCTGPAPEALCFELGVRNAAGPLLSFGPGELVRYSGDLVRHY